MDKKTKAEQFLAEQDICSVDAITKKIPSSETADFDKAYRDYVVNMTSEEAQKEILDIFMLSVIRAKKMWKLSHAHITDFESGNYVEGMAIVERLSDTEIVESINGILESNPALLEEWESIALSDILGREIILNKQYIPIEESEFRKALIAL